jgi:hypothetical protein
MELKDAKSYYNVLVPHDNAHVLGGVFGRIKLCYE